MRDFSACIKAIQAAAGGKPVEQITMDMLTSSNSAADHDPVEQRGVDPPPNVNRIDWPRADIIAALEKGASSRALLLCLQAISDLSGDPSFAAEAIPLTKAAQTGEAWKRAYRTYSRYAPMIIDAGRRNDMDAACDLFSDAAQDVSGICSEGDPISEHLAIAVYEALSQLFDMQKHCDSSE